MDLKETYDRIADDWVKDHADDAWWQPGTEVFLSLLPVGGAVLDIGCAGGDKTKYINDKGFEATGVDFSKRMVEIARAKFPELAFEVLDVFDIESHNTTYNGVFAQAMLLHIPKDKIVAVLRNLAQRLKVDGHLYVAVKAVRADRSEEGIVTENDYGYEYQRFFSYFSANEMRGYFEQIGLDVVWETVAIVGRAEWIQIIGKKVS